MSIGVIYISPKTPLHDFLDMKSPIDHEFRIAELGRSQGELMNQTFKKADKPAKGVDAAGGFVYSYKGSTIDLFGEITN